MTSGFSLRVGGVFRSAALFVVFAVSALGQSSGAGAHWVVSARSGDIQYLGYASPSRIERYNMATEAWLEPLVLTDVPTALHVDGTSVYVAYDRALMRVPTDGSPEQPVFNAANKINGILSDSTFLFVFAPGYSQSRITSVRKSDLVPVATYTGTYDISSGYSIAPQSRRIYGVNVMTTAFSTIEVDYAADGTFGNKKELWSDSGSFGDTAKTLVYPDETTVVRNNGIAYHTGPVSKRGSVAGSFTDAAIHGADVLIVLRSDKLHAYSNALLESGVYDIGHAASTLAIRGASAFTFAADAGSTRGVRVTKVAIASITPAAPASIVDPTKIEFVPDQILAIENDTFLLFSREKRSIFVWSAAESRYKETIPLTGSPTHIAYSGSLGRIYAGYGTGKITKIEYRANGRVDVPFVNLPTAVLGLQALDDHLFAVDASGAWNTFYTFSSTGTLISSNEWRDYSQTYIWNAANRRVYHLRDDTSPNDIEYVEIAANGTMGNTGESPYHGDFGFYQPIRVAPSGASILIGSGHVFSGADLTYVGSLSNTIDDADWIGSRWVTLRDLNSATQLQIWQPNLLISRSVSLPGEPVRIFGLTDGSAVAFTEVNGMLVVSKVPLAGNDPVQTSPVISSKPQSTTKNSRESVTLTVTASGTGLSYQWYKDGVVIQEATTSSLTIPRLSPRDAGSYSVRVSNAMGEQTTTPVALFVTRLKLAERPDFDGDGKTDLLVQDWTTGQRSVLQMNVTSVVSTNLLTTVTSEWQINGLADFDDDADVDLLWRNRVTGEAVIHLYSGFTMKGDQSLGVVDPSWKVGGSGDFNGDGKSDIVWQNVSTGERRVGLMNGTSLSSYVSLSTVGTDWSIVGVADFNANGRPDLLWRHRVLGMLAVWLMDGVVYQSGSTVGTVPLTWEVVQVGDFSNDGKPDILWRQSATGATHLWVMNGTAYSHGIPGFTSTQQVGTSSLIAPVPGDYDGDQRADVAFSNGSTGEQVYWKISSTGGMIGSGTSLGADAAWRRVVVADLDGDNEADVVWQNTSTNQVAVWMMRASVVVRSAILGQVPAGWVVVGTGDFVGGSSPDLVWHHRTTGQVAAWGLDAGALSGQYTMLGSADAQWRLVGVGDFDGNSTEDLLWRNQNTQQLVVWNMSGSSYTGATFPATLSADVKVVQVADYNGDRIADVVVQNTVQGTCSILRSSGGILSAWSQLGSIPSGWTPGLAFD